MNYIKENDRILICDKSDFNIDDTLLCGQIFSYQKTLEGYDVFSKDKRATVHYQFGHGEYLKDILEKFGVSFDKK